MPRKVSCGCGRVLIVPQQSAALAVRCPKCGGQVLVPPDEQGGKKLEQRSPRNQSPTGAAQAKEKTAAPKSKPSEGKSSTKRAGKPAPAPKPPSAKSSAAPREAQASQKPPVKRSTEAPPKPAPARPPAKPPVRTPASATAAQATDERKETSKKKVGPPSAPPRREKQPAEQKTDRPAEPPLPPKPPSSDGQQKPREPQQRELPPADEKPANGSASAKPPPPPREPISPPPAPGESSDSRTEPSPAEPPPLAPAAPRPSALARWLRTDVRGYEHRGSQVATVYYLAGSMVFVALFGLAPAIVETIDHFRNLEDSPGIPRWVYVLLLLAVVQIGYVVYLAQLPDWSSVWVATLLSVSLSAMYALLLGAAMMSPADPPQIVSILQLDAGAYQKTAGWCFIMLCVTFALSYFCGRISVRWRQSFDSIGATRRTST